MNLTSIRTTSTVNLVKCLSLSETQEETNILAYELAYRLFVPGTDISFESLLYSFGWKQISKEKPATLTKSIKANHYERHIR